MTLVVDASAVAELLLNTTRHARIAAAIGDHDLIAPNHLTVEVLSVLRGWCLGGHITESEGVTACDDYVQLGITTVDMASVMKTVWALRHNITAYDAMYVVLARTAECPLLTLDAKLAAAAPDCAVTP